MDWCLRLSAPSEDVSHEGGDCTPRKANEQRDDDITSSPYT